MIKIHFTRPKNKWLPLPYLIRLFEWTKYSHVSIEYFDNKYEEKMIFQSNFFGTHFINKKFFDKENEIVRTFEINTKLFNEEMAIKFMLQVAGTGYGFCQLFFILVYKMMKLFTNKIRLTKINGNEQLICSETVFKVLQKINPNFHINLNQDYITPSDLYEILQELSKKP